MRGLIASNNAELAQRIRQVLADHGLECPDDHLIDLDLAAERASRLSPDLVALVLPSEPASGLDTVREIRAIAPNVAVFVVGLATDAKLIRRGFHEGADEFLDQGMLESELAEALIRFKARGSAPPERKEAGKLVSVLAASGGSGASMLAASLSVALAERYRECALVDLRLNAGDLASMLDVKPTYTVTDFCDNVDRIDQSLFERFLVRHQRGVSLLAAPGRFVDLGRVTAKGVRRMLGFARARFPYVVVDVDRALGEEQAEAVWQSDIVLLVLRLDYTSVRNTRQVLDRFADLGIEGKRVRLVVNTRGQSSELGIEQAEAALGMRVAYSLPNDPATVNQAINSGIPVVLSRPSAKVSKRIRELAAGISAAPEPKLVSHSPSATGWKSVFRTRVGLGS